MPVHDEVLLVSQRFRVVRRSYIGPSGQTLTRDAILHPGAVVILPLLADQRVCLIRNYRAAVERTLIELPAGTLDHNEDPLEAASRELIEETGFIAGRIEPLCEFFMSPGILHERMHLVLASELAPGPASPEPGEEIETLIVPWSQAVQMALDGTIQDAKTMTALLYYDRRLGSSTPSPPGRRPA
jgi:ADP-ribose pyrophosphatase